MRWGEGNKREEREKTTQLRPDLLQLSSKSTDLSLSFYIALSLAPSDPPTAAKNSSPLFPETHQTSTTRPSKEHHKSKVNQSSFKKTLSQLLSLKLHRRLTSSRNRLRGHCRGSSSSTRSDLLLLLLLVLVPQSGEIVLRRGKRRTTSARERERVAKWKIEEEE